MHAGIPDALPQADAATASSPGLPFATLNFLLAAAILLHEIHETGLLEPRLADSVLVLAALWVLLHPSSVGGCLVLAAAQLAACWQQMPYVWNHWLFLAFADIAILAAAGEIALRRGGRIRGEDLYAAVAPALRLALIELYAVAAFSKLNHAYLDPQTSCATALYQRLTSFLPLLPSGAWTAAAAIWGSVAIEIALVLLLILRRTRLAALLVGAGFHLLLGLNDNYDFSAILLPFYSLFVPPEMWAGAARIASRSPRLRTAATAIRSAARQRLAFPTVATVAIVAGRVAQTVEPQRLQAHLLRGGKILWLALGAVLAALSIAAVRLRPASAPPARSSHPRWSAALVGPLLVGLAALTPYLGLNTEHAFAMFSNLRTEAGEWNHLVVPSAVRVFHFQDRLYEIADSSDPVLAKIAVRRESVVAFELRRRLSTNPDSSVSLLLDGQRRDLARGGDDAELSAPLSPLLARLFWFRPVLANGACAH